jgi:hypothetical protein
MDGAPAKKRGVSFKSKVGQKAPEGLKELPTPQEEALSLKPAAVAREMFGKPKSKAAAKPKTAAKPKAAEVAEAKAAVKEITEDTKPVKSAKAEEEAANVIEAQAEADAEAEEAEAEEAKPIGGLTSDLREMADLIEQEESRDLYNTQVPTAYVPQTRRGFADFIKVTYKTFELPDGPIPESDKYYPYQKFVRDYMRKESPYRGLLVYHGLGSGKTCTAIAAAEALFASAKKKIIVMSPKSLRANFLREVSKCGFRHFQLNNFWTSLDPADATTALFANQILGLSGKYLKSAKHVWVPDFRKGPTESNYKTLPPDDREEIRKQILSILEWHPEKNPTGRIRFISYNGISAKKLMAMACDESPSKFFDDAVIVVDEVHNLIRNIQGKIEPYLVKEKPGMKKSRRTIPVEEIGPGRWRPNPTLCASDSKLYTRGYLFYRLLLDARNSKIIGLSGTPLINFPEEIGILANVLHGYITIVEGVIQQSGAAAIKAAQETALAHPFTDFVRVKSDPAGGGIRVIFTLLPPGVQKIANDTGVERIPPEEAIPTFEEILDSVKDTFKEAGMEMKTVTTRAEALLPPFGDDFRENFAPNGQALANKTVLITRLTGLISFYKGSRLELMPRVKSDEVVRVPFSLYAQKAYSFKRSTELKKEMEKKPGQTVDAVWAQIYEMGDSAAANNYKMGSRQACNFAFPPEVTRPSPNAKEAEEEAEGGVVDGELLTLAPEEEGELPPGEVEVEQEFPDLEDEPDDELEAEAEAEEEAEAEAEVEAATEQQGGAKTVAQIREEKLAADCKTGTKVGEKYKDACARAKKCLATVSKARMTVGGEDGLANYSAKYAAMLEKIAAAPGSSLIYSQFLDMEGVGIFRVAMDVNGYAPIEIELVGGTVQFSKATEESLRKGPGAQPRYLTFSGGEKQEVRAAALSIFNAQFSDLPDSMNVILKEAGYTDNKVGELCRVFCITSAGAEGLSLRNVRAVHIMEPYWNEVRLRQVKGRAIRIGSHLDLPEDQRDVSIYTYISCFSDDAQLNRVPESRIDQTILQHDGVDAKKAIDAGLPMQPGMTSYVLTTDEMIYTISERKRKIIEALESVMKSAAVDCELNYKQNKDGSFKCLPLKGSVGDFIYNPVLREDILEASRLEMAPPAKPKAAAVGPPKPKDIFKKLKGVTYRMRPVADAAGKVIGFDMFEADQAEPTKAIPEKKLGTAGATAEGAPGPPVKFL